MPLYRPKPTDKNHDENRCMQSLPLRVNAGTIYLCNCGRAFKCTHATNGFWKRITPKKYNKILIKQQKRKEKYEKKYGKINNA
jgi:hypothetical protein